MAQLPCTVHGAKFLGPSSHAYPALVSNDGRESKKHRLCRSCLSDLLGAAGKFLHGATETVPRESLDVLTACGWCGDQVDGDGRMVYLTAYPAGGDRQDWVGAACSKHVGQARSELILS